MKLLTTISEEYDMTAPEPLDSAAPIHPGYFLSEILDELQISHDKLARAIDVSPESVTAIVNGHMPITGDMALRIGKAFWMSPESWMNLQKMYEIETARLSTDTSLIVPLVPPPDDDFLRVPVAKFVNL